MVATGLRRAGALVGLLGALLVVMVGFGSVPPDPALGSYPSTGDLVVDYEQHVGDRVQVTGIVTRSGPVIIEDDYAVWVGDRYRTGTVRLRITALDRPVRRGQTLQVFGVAQPNGGIRSINSVVVPAGNRLYTYLVSALAGGWVLYRLLRGWRFDRATLAVRRRADPLDRRAVIAVLLGSEGERDA